MSKILLEAHQIQKSFGEQIVLHVKQLCIYDGEKIALIGENGAGKSTFLSVLAGETEPDHGEIRRYCSLCVIHQSGEAIRDGSASIASQFQAQVRRNGLSGGEMTRRRIVEALSCDSSLLFADEPTTDLDANGIEQLKKHLLSYSGKDAGHSSSLNMISIAWSRPA